MPVLLHTTVTICRTRSHVVWREVTKPTNLRLCYKLLAANYNHMTCADYCSQAAQHLALAATRYEWRREWGESGVLSMQLLDRPQALLLILFLYGSFIKAAIQNCRF